MLLEKEAIPLIKSILMKYGEVELPSAGNSMYPFIQAGDICNFTKCDPLSLKKGDIVLFQTVPGQLVAHRLGKKYIFHNENYYLFKGDTNLGFDKPVRKEQIIGKLTVIKRKNRRMNVSTVPAFIWGQVILRLPILSGYLRNYLNRKAFF